MPQQYRLTRHIISRAMPVTWALGGLIAAIYVIEIIVGAPDDITKMIRLGANVPLLVHAGQWWRLLTAGFLHGSFQHILFNGMALLSIGSLLERLIGSTRFLIIALVANVGGNIASAMSAGHDVSVGASSCVFGLFGALLVVQIARRAMLPPQLVLSRQQWIYLLGVNALISLLPGIDLSAHVGGFVTGSVCGALLFGGLDIRAPRAGWSLRVTAGLLTGAFALAFLLAANQFFGPATLDLRTLANPQGYPLDGRRERANAPAREPAPWAPAP